MGITEHVIWNDVLICSKGVVLDSQLSFEAWQKKNIGKSNSIEAAVPQMGEKKYEVIYARL